MDQTSPSDNVFGPFSHEPPRQPAGEEPKPGTESLPPVDLPQEPVVSKAGVIVMPTFRFDGGGKSWNRPEPEIWDLLRGAEIEHVEERVLDGTGGTFWARIKDGEKMMNVLLKLDGPTSFFYQRWSEGYLLNQESHDRITRELVAYEVGKAFGCEDLIPPLAARDINVVPLISDAIREKIGRQLRISTGEVDDRLGIAAIVQMAPNSFDNFLEYWNTSGASNKERWQRATDSLRHSLYRAYALDFLMGCFDRPLCSYLYNDGTDKICIVDLALSFPNPVAEADQYLEARQIGWGRKMAAGLKNAPEGAPASLLDLRAIMSSLSGKWFDECVETFQQMCDAMTDEIEAHLVLVMRGYGLPEECIAGLFSRLAYLQSDPSQVLHQSFDYVRNLLVPMRRGYGGDLVAQVVDLVNFVMSTPEQPFDFASAMSGQVPEEAPPEEQPEEEPPPEEQPQEEPPPEEQPQEEPPPEEPPPDQPQEEPNAYPAGGQ